MEELLRKRAELHEKLDQLNAAIAAYQSMKPRAISTRKSLRNAWLNGVAVYDSIELVRLADPSSHDGWVSGEGAAILLKEGVVDGDYCSLY